MASLETDVMVVGKKKKQKNKIITARKCYFGSG